MARDANSPLAGADPARPERRAAFSENPRVGRRGAETHARLLRAGLLVLGAEGYHGARVEAIAAQAECSRPTFYQYFADKTDFFLHLASHVSAELGAVVDGFPALGPDRASRDRLRAWLARLAALHAAYAPVFRYEALLRSDARIARGSERRLLGAGRVIAAAIDAGPGGPPASVALGAVVYSTVVQAFGWRPSRWPEARLLDGAADWCHRCFVGPLHGVNLAQLVPVSVPGRRVVAAGNGGSPVAAPASEGGKAARSRARLLEAAREAFERLGYDGTRIDDVASAAALSHGTFYRYFESKEAIFRELAGPALEDLLVLLDELPDPRGGLHSWARRLYQTHALHGVLSAWAESERSRGVLPGEVPAEIQAAADRALAGCAFADRAVERLLFLAHAERAPALARAYPGLPEPDAIAASGEILARGFFGA